MFDSVLNQRKVARQRAVGGVVSVLAHVAIIGGIIWYSAHKAKANEGPKAVPVAFLNTPKAAVAVAPPPPPPPPKKHKTTPHTVVKKDIIIPKKVEQKPPEKPPDPTPPDDSDDSDDDDDGVEGGVVGGVKGGVVGGVVGGTLGAKPTGDEPVFFGEGMTKPVMDPQESENFKWTRAQLDARLEGLCLCQCVITKDGTLKDCKILKRIAQVDDAQIMQYLSTLKFHPAMQGGKPISLKGFTIPLRLKAE